LTGEEVAAPSASGGAQRIGSGAEPLAAIVFAVLVVACFGAFFLTQRLKHTPTVLQSFERTPTFAPRSSEPERRLEKLSFKISHADEVTVTIIDARGNTVATLVRDYPVQRYKQLSLRWNGRRGAARRYRQLTISSSHRALLPINEGPLAPEAEYRVRVVLREQGKEVLSPRSFRLEHP
jgi:hypothetical protein